jgi:hypothetical protein
MKIKFLIIMMSALVLALAVACQPATQQEVPQTQPGETEMPIEEPPDAAYPGPAEVEPAESGSETEKDVTDELAPGDEQAYPEPNLAAPVDQVPFEISVQHEFSPVTGDAALEQGNVFINERGVLILESYPVKVELVISGDLPTPCHHLRAVVAPPDENNEIQVMAYSVSDPEMVCTQVLAPFDATIPIGNFTSGSYRVMVNGELAGMIDLP